MREGEKKERNGVRKRKERMKERGGRGRKGVRGEQRGGQGREGGMVYLISEDRDESFTCQHAAV